MSIRKVFHEIEFPLRDNLFIHFNFHRINAQDIGLNYIHQKPMVL